MIATNIPVRSDLWTRVQTRTTGTLVLSSTLQTFTDMFKITRSTQRKL